MSDFQLGQVVKMKKGHPCGANIWKIIRIGADFRIQCLYCNRSVMIPRAKFERKVKKILTEEEVEQQLGNLP